MLDSMKNVDSNIAQNVLSRIVRDLLPSINVEVSSSDDQLYADTLSEILEKLKLSRDSISYIDRIKIFSLLIEEMSSLSLNKEKEESVKMRLGSKGLLQNSDYKIKFHDGPYNSVSRQEVIKTVKNSDGRIHLNGDKVGEADSALVSIYIKRLKFRKEDMIIIVQVERKGYELVASNAWKFFVADVDLSVLEPLGVMESFTDAFGVRFSLLRTAPAKFILYKNFPVTNFNPVRDLVVVDGQDKRNIMGHGMFRMSSAGVLEVVMVCMIDMDKYNSRLRERGVKIIN